VVVVAAEIPADSCPRGIAILLTGVVARFVFHRPIIWSDELASMLFLWMAMLGSVVALRRGEHMRMTALVGRTSGGRRALIEALATAASLAFLALILVPAVDYALDERAIVTSALEISNGWRAAALPVGIATIIFPHKASLKRQSISSQLWESAL
jgi:TRAP-type C4-dicarboxylate transport system permease small subunit